MFLQSITLQGFKSFADRTTLELEPGVTVVVGPNGSGKSNVVDALAWVLGSHSPTALRGASMSDVVFAGAPGRPAVGRAWVEIRIDNSDGSLPIDYSEVAVSRALYASGESEYAINGTPCRLLDVADLLNDAGLGREQHTIVGQGRLDEILHARPDQRRAFIEEAAGILAHRRRKERALRKLERMGEHVARLTDLAGELTRQTRPLERQAQAALRHADLVRRRREVRVAIGLRALDRLVTRADAADVADAALEARGAAVDAEVAAAGSEEVRLAALLAEVEPQVGRAAATHLRLTSVAERLRGLVDRVAERRHGLLDAVEEPADGREPAALRAEADEADGLARRLDREVEHAADRVRRCQERREDAEGRRRAHAREVARLTRERASARELRLRLQGEVRAIASALEQAVGEQGRLEAQAGGLAERVAGVGDEIQVTREEIRRLDAAAPDLDARLRAAERRMVTCSDVVDDLSAAERDLERERASLRARADALRATATGGSDGSQAVLSAARAGHVQGVVGPLVERVRVESGMAAAVAEALRGLGGALLVADADAAVAALGHADAHGVGRLVVAVPAPAPPPGSPARDAAIAAAGGRRLLDAVSGEPEATAAVSWALRDVYLVADLTVARRLATEHPDATFVTPAGASAGARGWAAGGAGDGAAVLALAGAQEAERRLAAVDEELAVVHRRLTEADGALSRARDDVDAATVMLQESDGRITAAADRLERLENEAARARTELAERRTQLADLADRIASQQRRGEDLRRRLAADDADTGGAGGGGEAAHAEAADGPAADDVEVDDPEGRRLDAQLEASRDGEVHARLDLRSAEAARDDALRTARRLRREAADVTRRRELRERARLARIDALERCDALAATAAGAAEAAATARDEAEHERATLTGRQAAWRAELDATRRTLRAAEQQLAEITEQRHRIALTRAEVAAERAQVVDGLREVAGAADVDALLQAARRDAAADDPQAVLAGDDRRDTELADEATRLDATLRRIGDVNHLAAQELERLRERQAFLTAQLQDLADSERDLRQVVAAVDERIRQVFAAAFDDVAAAFADVFGRLFPGGEGRLVLTDPDDLLTTGVEVRARPAGKRVSRLSLLSGGERSLTALAIVFAIFAARPSPFYVLDEVEAALDDVNLQRFLDVVCRFRASSQLIVVTHQQRTMEIADVLYGVTMRATGVSTVVGQRAHELVGSG